jgi:sugar lactone lactonase YvrE
MSVLDVRHPGLLELVEPDASLQRIATGFRFTEGPVWRDGALYFSDIPNSRIVRYRLLSEGPEIRTYGLGHCNGLTLDRTGHLIVAEHYGRRLSRVAEDGSRTVLADQYQGRRLNSPNDVVVKSDGSIYFTDPPYGVQTRTAGSPRAERWWTAEIPGKELNFNGVYRLTVEGELQLLVDDNPLPNGLAFSPDESVLYVDDSGLEHVRAFRVKSDGTLADGRIILSMACTEPAIPPAPPDGLKVDARGNVYCAGVGGVWVCRADGTFLGRILIPESPSNLAWGEDGSVLFFTARTSVYRLQTKTSGILPGFPASRL